MVGVRKQEADLSWFISHMPQAALSHSSHAAPHAPPLVPHMHIVSAPPLLSQGAFPSFFTTAMSTTLSPIFPFPFSVQLSYCIATSCSHVAQLHKQIFLA